jgi:hypothetical protein
MKMLPGIMIALVTLGAAGCASGVGPATAPPTVDVTGRWVGSWVATNPALGSGTIEMTLKQTGSQYSGSVLATRARTDPSGPTQGIVSGNEVRMIPPSGMIGSLTVQGDTMFGLVHGVVDANVSLRRQK